MFKCPVCFENLTINKSGATCRNSHHFDRSKQGYIHLLTSNKKHRGDNKEMTQARHRFLSKGHYQFLVTEINKQLNNMPGKVLLDLGCGEGFYTNQLNKENIIGIDLSKESLKIASRNQADKTYLVASIADLPIQDESVDIIVKLFAPTYEEEMLRVLKPHGFVIVVDVGIHHLHEMKKQIYDKMRLNDLKTLKMNLIQSYTISEKKTLKNEELVDLFTMTPYRYNTKIEDSQKLLKLEELNITFEFFIHIYNKSNH